MQGMESDLRVLIRRLPRLKLCGNPMAEVRRAVLKMLPWQLEVAGDASASVLEETCLGIRYGSFREFSVGFSSIQLLSRVLLFATP